MAQTLFSIIIYPLYEIIELVYEVCQFVFDNCGISIIGVSTAITLLCLPLYAVAEHWQQTERELQARMKNGIARIKATFSGDEQYMILNAFYREHGYHPIMALRSSFGLLIQIPFFIAAYQFLSNDKSLAGQSFLFIKDLGAPDAMFIVHGFAVNLLPLSMTLINIAAGAVYTKGFAVKEKLQLYGMALVFLVILYNSPSGLVLYWTMNNVFSLIKNIFYKLKNPLKIFFIGVCACAAVMDIYLLAAGFKYAFLAIAGTLLIGCIPLILKLWHAVLVKTTGPLLLSPKLRLTLFATCAVGLCVLSGLYIPSSVIASSPGEFSYIDSYASPLFFIANVLLQSAGLCIFWPLCIYFLYDKYIQSGLTVFFVCLLASSLVCIFIFPGSYGFILPTMLFSEHPVITPSAVQAVLNITAAAGVCLLCIVLLRMHKIRPLAYAAAFITLGAAGYGGINAVKIHSFFINNTEKTEQLNNIQPIMHFSKTGKNVVMIMLDAATGYYVEPVFEELPALKKQFSGFTAFSNTVSLAGRTLQGSPALYGGYEYGPWEMNRHPELTMRDKHNQALSLQSDLFGSNGFESIVVDPPYPNYDERPLFSFLKHSTGYDLRGRYNDLWAARQNMQLEPIKSRKIKRNMLWYSVFRMAPNVIRPIIYARDWWQPEFDGEDIIDFLNNYAVLDLLPQLTDTKPDGNFYMNLDSEITHDTQFCQAPDYTLALKVTDRGASPYKDSTNFHSQAAAFRLLAKWFDYLREQGVYDNTRIIISADHGSGRGTDVPLSSEVPKESHNPLLMIKDFNVSGDCTIDTDTFMCHADVPQLVFDGIIDRPVNPATGKEIKKLSTQEKNALMHISFSRSHNVRETPGNKFPIDDDEWYTVRDSIFDPANWKQSMETGERP